MEQEKLSLEEEKRKYESKRNEIIKKINSEDSEKKARLSKIEKAADLKIQFESAKVSIEKMFMEYYGLAVHINE